MNTTHTLTLGIVIAIVLAVAITALPTHASGLNLFSITYTNMCASYTLAYFGTGPMASPLSPGFIRGHELDFSGPATLVVTVNVVASGPVELVFGPLTPSYTVDITWNTEPSTIISGTYTISVPGPGQYFLGIFNVGYSDVYIDGYMSVSACGDSQFVSGWLSENTAFYSTPMGLTMSPTGIVANGVMEVGGQLYTYTLSTDAVEGVLYIPSNIQASDYYQDGTYFGNAFTVQLNAFVVVQLLNGQTQYYWSQNAVVFDGGQLWVEDNVWNYTTYVSNLDMLFIHGNGGVYYLDPEDGYYYGYEMPNPIPFGQVTLEISTGLTASGAVVINFYADGQNYDTVTITPSAPVTSVSIVIAPEETPRTIPLDLELVLAGYDSDAPYVVLQGGSISMSLYIDMNGHWVPPPSAWSAGGATYESAYANAVPNGVGSVIVEPGQPTNEELWGGTVIATPLGDYVTTSTDLTQYASHYFPQVVNFGNGTRLVLNGVVVNGQSESLSNLGYVPLGSLVFATYATQYLVRIYAPTNTTTTWVNAGASILIDEPQVISFGNGTRLVNPTLGNEPVPATVVVITPLELTVSYTRQYLVTQTSIFGTQSVWVNAGMSITPNASTYVINEVLFKPLGMVVNGIYETITTLTVSKPLNITIDYLATANVSTTTWGLPALYASATLTCGWSSVTTSGYLTSGLTVSMPNPPTYICTVNTSIVPLAPVLVVIAIMVIALALLVGRRRAKPP